MSTPTSLVLAVLRDADALRTPDDHPVAVDLSHLAITAPTRAAAVDGCAELLDTALGYGTAGSDTTRELASAVVDAVRKENDQ